MTSRMRTRTRSTAAVVVALASVGVTLAACNFIVDAGDYKVGNVGGGSDGSTGGMDAPPGLDTGSPGDSTAPMPEGSTSDTGTATDTGTTGNPDGPVGCGSAPWPTTSAFQSLVEACALAESCTPGGFNFTLSDCIQNDALHAIPIFGCLVGATSCAQVQACTGNNLATAAECPSISTPAFCNDAGAAVNCNSNYYAAGIRDCKVLGGTCGVYTVDGGLPIADCNLGVACSDPTDPNASYCTSMGNDWYSCINGKAYGQNCGPNATCVADPVNGTTCYFKNPSCNYGGSDTYTCGANNTVDLCTQSDLNATGGGLIPFNCSSAGLTCADNADGQGTAECLAPGCTGNDVANCSEQCSGTMAKVCLGGAPYEIDCSKIPGFTTCASLTDGAGNSYIACQ
jgi:hypothetical protein